MNIYIDDDNLSADDKEKLASVTSDRYASMIHSIELTQRGGRFDIGDVTITFDTKENVESGNIDIDGEEITLRDEDDKDNPPRIYRTYATEEGFVTVVSDKAIQFFGIALLHSILDIIICDSINFVDFDDIGWKALGQAVSAYVTGILLSNPPSQLTDTFCGQSIMPTLLKLRKDLYLGKVDDKNKEFAHLSYFFNQIKLCTYFLMFLELGMGVDVITQPDDKIYVDLINEDSKLLRPYVTTWLKEWNDGEFFTNVDVNSAKLIYRVISDKLAEEVKK